MVDLRTLETFVEVANCLSFSDAGRRLGVPASTVTTRVKSLEARYSVRLLDRSTRTVALTAEGQQFLLHCRRALKEMSLADEIIGRAQKASGQVRISIPTAFPKKPFAEIVREFRSLYPDISIKVFVDDRPVSFIEEGVDLALRGRAPGSDSLIARHLIDTEIIFVGPLGHINDEGLPILRPIAKGSSEINRQEGLATGSFELSLEFVISGQARAYLPRPTCQEAIKGNLLEEGEGPDGPQEPLPLFLVYHDKYHQTKRIQLFKDFLISAFTKNNAKM
ncbi:LysR family transcriptional regulator [Ahrensia sp. 13_GOM-1096m]|uniref:LysR family transcriptional regulator n=1 Tax=Ahrensia sp. 13_GOM-1096m TaxID=1380380 RepID=UPI000479DE36|nr:LysR family transcriptional regulator [Ahrensia sp. 13_GOM-1096m]